MGLDSHHKDCFLPLVHCGKLVNIAIELGKSRVKGRSFLAKQRNENGGVVVESISPHLVERLAEVFLGLRRFSELEHAVLNADTGLVIQGVESEFTHMEEVIEVDWLELILKDSHNFLLWEACKLEGDAHNFGGDLICDIVFFFCRNPPSWGRWSYSSR